MEQNVISIFLARQREELRKAGWDASIKYGAFDGDCIPIYVIDAATGVVRLGGQAECSLLAVEKVIRKETEPAQVTCSALSALIEEDGSIEDIVIVATLYFCATNTWHTVKSGGLLAHSLFVLKYGKMDDTDSFVRPFAIKTQSPYTANEVVELAESVIATDYQRHPERFNGSPPRAIPRLYRNNGDRHGVN